MNADTKTNFDSFFTKLMKQNEINDWIFLLHFKFMMNMKSDLSNNVNFICFSKILIFYHEWQAHHLSIHKILEDVERR